MPLPEQDLARIAFVTRRFAELQGLRTAALGAAVVISVVASTMAPTDFGDPLTQIVLPVQNATYALAIGLNGYYSRCFGRVPLPGHLRGNSRPSWDLAAGAAPYAIMLGMSVDFLKGFFYPGGVSYGAVVVAAFSAWIVWRDWPYRAIRRSRSACLRAPPSTPTEAVASLCRNRRSIIRPCRSSRTTSSRRGRSRWACFRIPTSRSGKASRKVRSSSLTPARRCTTATR